MVAMEQEREKYPEIVLTTEEVEREQLVKRIGNKFQELMDKQSNACALKGGTAMRLSLGLPRVPQPIWTSKDNTGSGCGEQFGRRPRQRHRADDIASGETGCGEERSKSRRQTRQPETRYERQSTTAEPAVCDRSHYESIPANASASKG